VLAAAVACWVAATDAPAQAPSATFPSKIELITVDVVVVDESGQPVPGLTRDDFVIEEDGRPRTIVSFEAVRLEATPGETSPVAAVVATNEAASEKRPGRAFAIVLDDLGLELADAVETRRAVTQFLQQSVQDGDEVTVATTSADAWWSARIPEGRDDLLAVTQRLRSRTSNASTASDYMSDYEAFWIDTRGETAAAFEIARVIKRWTDNHICFDRDPGCGKLVEMRARGLEGERRQRTTAALETVRRALLSLGPVRGRKSLLLFSRGFIQDFSQEIRGVVAASRETNTAVFFIDARGLTTNLINTGMSASAPGMPDVTQFGRMNFENNTLAAAGATALAEETGGFVVHNTNDLAAGAERVAAESRVFYMLGFEASPGKKRGEWRKLHVEVQREGLKVRARRGYTVRAEAPAAKAVPTKEGTRTLPPAVETALDTAHEVAGIPLRAVTYVLEPREKDTTHVLVAAEFDASGLTYEGSGKSRAARLEVTAAATLRDTGKTLYSDERVEVRAPEGEAPGWRSVAREFDLPPGVAQARIIVRDPSTGAMGAVAQRVEVPRPDAFRLSTPILSDQVVSPSSRDAKPRAAVAAHRTFRPGGGLYCEYEVFGAGRDPSGSAPTVSAGLLVRTAAGEAVRQAAPTRIIADRDGRLVRLVGLDLAGLAPGEYELILDVHDEGSGATVERREPFTIAP